MQAKDEETQSGLSAHHRDLDRMSESEILRLVVAGIDVARNSDSRIVRQHALNALGHLFRAIGDRDLP